MAHILSTLQITISSVKKKEALDLLNFLIGPMCQQPGCMGSRAYQDLENPNKLTLVDEWETREDLERHVGSDGFRQKLSLMELSSRPPEIHYHTVSTTEGMELIIKVREGRKLNVAVP